jgi:hypothetical protein
MHGMAVSICTHRGKVACRRLWQIGMEHAPGEEEEYADDDGSEADVTIGAPKGPKTICTWLKGPADVHLARGAAGIWVNVFDSGPHPGKVCGVCMAQHSAVLIVFVMRLRVLIVTAHHMQWCAAGAADDSAHAA